MLYKFPQASQPGEPYSMEYPVEYLKWSTPKSHVQFVLLKKNVEPFRCTYFSFVFTVQTVWYLPRETERTFSSALSTTICTHNSWKDKRQIPLNWENKTHQLETFIPATYTLLVIHFAPVSAPTYPPQQKRDHHTFFWEVAQLHLL